MESPLFRSLYQCLTFYSHDINKSLCIPVKKNVLTQTNSPDQNHKKCINTTKGIYGDIFTYSAYIISSCAFVSRCRPDYNNNRLKIR